MKGKESRNSIKNIAYLDDIKKLIESFDYVVGVDEVGRGCIAGPLVVCAVVLRTSTYIEGVKDSKLLSPKQRERLLPLIVQKVEDIGIGFLSNKFIDDFGMGISIRVGILEALSNLNRMPKLIITDYVNIKSEAFENFLKGSNLPTSKLSRYREIYERLRKLDWMSLFKEQDDKYIFYLSLKKADVFIHSVSVASVVAKVLRDRYMRHISSKYPEYYFDRNKGYGTREHIKAIERNGVSKVHRLSFIHRKFYSQDVSDREFV